MTSVQSINQSLPAENNATPEKVNSIQPDNENGKLNSTSNSTLSNAKQSTQINDQTGAACTFKMERPKLPVFAGNVRDYAIFPSDFKAAQNSLDLPVLGIPLQQAR